MADIMSLDQIVAKWIRVTPGRSEDYRAGVTSPRKDWASAAAASEAAWAGGVSAAAAIRSFSRGVTAVGTPGWQGPTLSKGVTRWPEGVRGAEAKYRSGFSGPHGVIARTTLPPRGPAGDPGNIERTRVIAAALHDYKVRGG
jgi:hypothetical protein